MNLQIDFWQLIGLSISFLGVGWTAVWAMARVALSQAQRHQDANHAQLITRLEAIEQSAREEAGNWRRVEREIMQLKAELPLNYVRREDYAQAVATIMAKLDAVGMRLENILLRGAKNHE